MSEELGQGWKEKHFSEFDEKPFAAASIGQVHEATLKGENENGLKVAVKVQYPGVAKGIDSDIDNMLAILNYFKLIPEG